MHFGGGHYRRVRPPTRVGAHVQFQTKKPIRAFSGAAHFRIELFGGVLLRARRADNRGVHNGPAAQQQFLFLQMGCDLREQLLRQLVALQQMAKFQNRSFIWNLVLAQLQSRKAAHRLDVVKRVFHRRVRKIEPLLQKINPQHLLQAQRWSSIASFGIVLANNFQQLGPWHYLIHLFEKLFAPRLFLLASKCKRGKCRLTHPFVLLWLQLPTS